jgi:hypothetical protein
MCLVHQRLHARIEVGLLGTGTAHRDDRPGPNERFSAHARTKVDRDGEGGEDEDGGGDGVFCRFMKQRRRG